MKGLVPLENVIERNLVSLHPASLCGQSVLRQYFQSGVFLLPYLYFLSLPVIQTPSRAMLWL